MGQKLFAGKCANVDVDPNDKQSEDRNCENGIGSRIFHCRCSNLVYVSALFDCIRILNAAMGCVSCSRRMQ